MPVEVPKELSLEDRLNRERLKPNSYMTTILSGGMDSTTLLYYALSKTSPDRVKVLSFYYGQRHRKELECATKICADLGVDHKVVDISTIQGFLKSSLTSPEQAVPHGHYAEENMRQTVVPNRNAIMLSIAYGYSISNGSDYLVYGAHTGDHFIYPDCRPIFVKKLNDAFRKGNEGFGDTRIVAPFSHISKSEIVTVGLRLGVPFEKTWSCYEGQERPCLACGTCVERTEAFLDNNTQDPLLSFEEWDRARAIHSQAKEAYERR